MDFAIQVYNFLDGNVHDPTYGGYYITLTDTRKDTNVNLHVIEALIELYQALPMSHDLRPEVETASANSSPAFTTTPSTARPRPTVSPIRSWVGTGHPTAARFRSTTMLN